MKTDLQKILSVSGESGLFLYLSQGKTGIIAESIVTKKRTAFGISAKVTSLSDISIYTDDKEVLLRELFLLMKEHLAGAAALDHKSDTKLLVKFFEQVLPTYDKDKFYASHMKKVVQWYNILGEFASLDFVDPEAEDADAKEGAGKPAGLSGGKPAGMSGGKSSSKSASKSAQKSVMPRANAAAKKSTSIAKKAPSS